MKDKFEDHIRDHPDLKLIEELIESQKERQINNDDILFQEVYGDFKDTKIYHHTPEKKEEGILKKYKVPIRKHLVILDDCLSSDEVRAGYAGKLALLSTFSRHAEIIIIWVS